MINLNMLWKNYTKSLSISGLHCCFERLMLYMSRKNNLLSSCSNQSLHFSFFSEMEEIIASWLIFPNLSLWRKDAPWFLFCCLHQSDSKDWDQAVSNFKHSLWSIIYKGKFLPWANLSWSDWARWDTLFFLSSYFLEELRYRCYKMGDPPQLIRIILCLSRKYQSPKLPLW